MFGHGKAQAITTQVFYKAGWCLHENK